MKPVRDTTCDPIGRRGLIWSSMKNPPFAASGNPLGQLRLGDVQEEALLRWVVAMRMWPNEPNLVLDHSNGQASYANTVILDNRNASLFERLFKGKQVLEDKGQLRSRSAAGSTSEQYYGRFVAATV